MDTKPQPPKFARKRLTQNILITLIICGILASFTWINLTRDQSYIILPTLASLAIFILFCVILKFQIGDNLFGDMGFLYMALALIYTLFPAFTFISLELDIAGGWVWQNLSQLLPAPYELGQHLWRHVLFLSGVGVGYLLFRGRKLPTMATRSASEKEDKVTIIILISLLLVAILFMALLSAPVNSYIESYTRYDHLSWLPRKFVSLCTRIKQGMFVVLITFLFMNFKKYKFTTLFAVIVMSAYEIIFSYGARIEALIVLLMALVLYNYFVNTVTLKKGLLACTAIAVLFSALEILRAYDFDFSRTRSEVADAGGMKPASEFGAVYFTGFHLYSEREKGGVAPKEWPMFFNDFTSLVLPNNFTRWNPMYWYGAAYFPDSAVPPATVGIIADSAIWGGEWDLLLRSLINGVFFAYLVRWFIRHSNKWWGVAIYVFCYATCIMTIKYSVFYHLNPLFKTFLPTILVVEAFRRVIRYANKPAHATEPLPSPAP